MLVSIKLVKFAWRSPVIRRSLLREWHVVWVTEKQTLWAMPSGRTETRSPNRDKIRTVLAALLSAEVWLDGF